MKEFFYSMATDKKQGIGISIAKFFLALGSYVFMFFVFIRALIYKIGLMKIKKLPRSVISVGNITLGGSGKTPLVESLAQMIQALSKRPAILIRGYMPQGSGEVTSDEARMLEERLPNVPVLVGTKRFQTAQDFLSQKSADVFILDDGYQHWQMHRDINILVIDTTNPFGNGWVIPRGILRENLKSIKRADIVVFTKVDLGLMNIDSIKATVKKYHPRCPIIETIHEPKQWVDLKTNASLELSSFPHCKAVVLCGLGNPGAFEATLQKRGIEVTRSFHFLDHHVYSSADIHEVNSFCQREKIKYVLTTHKDSVKLRNLSTLFHEDLMVSYLDIQIAYTQGKDILVERISSLFRR